MAGLQREVRDFEPRRTGGRPDGLAVIRRLLLEAQFSENGGYFFLRLDLTRARR